MNETTPSVLYRIVVTKPATEDDFLSQWAKNVRAALAGDRRRAEPNDGETLHMWSGVSSYSEAEAARALVHELRQKGIILGDFVARLQIPTGAPIRVEKTGANPHHYTIWGSPKVLHGCVQSIEPV